MVEVTDEVRREALTCMPTDYLTQREIFNGLWDESSTLQALARIYQRGKIEGARLAIEAAKEFGPPDYYGELDALDPAKIVGEG